MRPCGTRPARHTACTPARYLCCSRSVGRPWQRSRVPQPHPQLRHPARSACSAVPSLAHLHRRWRSKLNAAFTRIDERQSAGGEIEIYLCDRENMGVVRIHARGQIVLKTAHAVSRVWNTRHVLKARKNHCPSVLTIAPRKPALSTATLTSPAEMAAVTKRRA